jgi:xanthosine utilization system XapX-like protein
VLLTWLFSRRMQARLRIMPALLRAAAAALVGGGIAYALVNLPLPGPQALGALIALAVGVLVAMPFVWKELKLLVRL